jgi:hypothetical protein
MGIIWTIIIGFVAGLLAKLIHPTNRADSSSRRSSVSQGLLWPVCTENLIRIDYLTESPNVSGQCSH